MAPWHSEDRTWHGCSAPTASAGSPTATSSPRSSRSRSRAARRTCSPAAAATGRPLAVIGRDTAAVRADARGRRGRRLRERRRRRRSCSASSRRPAVAHACARGGADLGVVLSRVAQPDARQRAQALRPAAAASCRTTSRSRSRRGLGDAGDRGPTGAGVGRITPAPRRGRALRRRTCSRRWRRRLDGLRVVVDCAHGRGLACSRPRSTGGPARRSSRSPPTRDGAEHQRRLPARPTSSVLQAAVVEHGADLGLAHDGDADRCLAVDATGAVVDGDQHPGAARRRRCADAGRAADRTPSSPP